MKTNLVITTAAALLLATSAQASTVIADWNFFEPGGTTLNNTLNTGAGLNGVGSSWNVGITGLNTLGNGLLNIANDGRGGSGTRSAYADFGPAFDQISSGTVSLYTHFAAWNPGLAANNTPSFTLALIEGNSFSTAQFTVAASALGYALSGDVDAGGAGAALAQAVNFATFAPLTVRLDVSLDHLDYALAYDLGGGFVTVGGAAIDPFTAGINSLRLGLSGDFSVAALGVDRIWLVATPTATPTAAVPEPGTLLLLLVGLLALATARPKSC